MISPTRAHYLLAIKLRYRYNDNMVEYETCITSLEAGLDMNVKHRAVYGGPILIISQSIGERGKPRLAKYKGYLTEISEAFSSVSFNYLSCSQNQFAAALATLFSILKIFEELIYTPIMVETHDRPI